jgi:hypothetical protein
MNTRQPTTKTAMPDFSETDSHKEGDLELDFAIISENLHRQT